MRTAYREHLDDVSHDDEVMREVVEKQHRDAQVHFSNVLNLLPGEPAPKLATAASISDASS